MSASKTCLWSASGEFACRAPPSSPPLPSPMPSAGREAFYWGDPNSYPSCLQTGCAAGKPCDSVSDCQNGLYCTSGVCARGNTFSEKNAAAAKASGNRQEVAENARAKEVDQSIQDLRSSKPDAQDTVEIDAPPRQQQWQRDPALPPPRQRDPTPDPESPPPQQQQRMQRDPPPPPPPPETHWWQRDQPQAQQQQQQQEQHWWSSFF